MKQKSEILSKIKEITGLSNIEKTSYLFANEIGSFLKNEIEEMEISQFTFRANIEKNFIRILHIVKKDNKSFFIFPDAIPGFTLLVFKKTGLNIDDSNQIEKNKLLNRGVLSLDVVSSVLEKFFKKNKNQTLMFNTDDLLIGLMPFEDIKSYFKNFDFNNS